MFCKIPSQPMARHGGTHLSLQLCEEAQIGGLKCKLAQVESETLSQKKLKQKGLAEWIKG
jgi:hypothetical protein